jgi:hypothetical protein
MYTQTSPRVFAVRHQQVSINHQEPTASHQASPASSLASPRPNTGGGHGDWWSLLHLARII